MKRFLNSFLRLQTLGDFLVFSPNYLSFSLLVPHHLGIRSKFLIFSTKISRSQFLNQRYYHPKIAIICTRHCSSPMFIIVSFQPQLHHHRLLLPTFSNYAIVVQHNHHLDAGIMNKCQLYDYHHGLIESQGDPLDLVFPNLREMMGTSNGLVCFSWLCSLVYFILVCFSLLCSWVILSLVCFS